jgi:hypothetical protein
MSHLSTITGVQLTSLGAIRRACQIANQKRNVALRLAIGAGQTIRGWGNTTLNKRYVAAIYCQKLDADVGLVFIPNTDQAVDASPILENETVLNGHFVLEGDLMLLGPLGPNLNLITNLYTATLIQAALGAQENAELEMELQNDNTVVLAG